MVTISRVDPEESPIMDENGEPLTVEIEELHEEDGSSMAVYILLGCNLVAMWGSDNAAGMEESLNQSGNNFELTVLASNPGAAAELAIDRVLEYDDSAS